MITDELKIRIREAFGLVPTAEQERAIGVFADFMTDRRDEAVMILRGSAGTGKTTLAAAIVRAMLSLQQAATPRGGHASDRMVLLAPTGRAAKVFSLYAGHAAYTIHRRIYRQKSMEGGFSLNFNAAADTLFIVDEASMISNQEAGDWGQEMGGSLLDDLIRFVYNGRNCRLLLIGDRAQLPPVGEEESPALTAEVLRMHGLHVYECDLNEVLRQSAESGILFNATRIRRGGTVLPRIRFQGFADIKVVPGNDLIDELANSYHRAGMDETIVITRSNKRANIYNLGIRNRILDYDAELCGGDRIMIVKNNYYWGKESGDRRQDAGLDFIANGDMLTLNRFRNERIVHGFRFVDATLDFGNGGDAFHATLLLDSLMSEAPSLTASQQQQLFQAVWNDYPEIRNKRERMKAVQEDMFYNALQVKYAYAVTCHKAQGGQWEEVFIDQGYITEDMLDADYLRWLYTAITRATRHVYLVNWPRQMLEHCVATATSA